MSIPQTLRTPSTVRALYALAVRLRTAGTVAQAFLGPQPRGTVGPGRSLVVFGGRASDDMMPVDWERQTYAETTDVPCTAVSWSGGADVDSHLDECAEIMDALRLLIEGDPTLGGVCQQATLGRRMDWTPESTDAGSSVAIDFAVRVQSYV